MAVLGCLILPALAPHIKQPLIPQKRMHNWKPSGAELKKGFRGWHQRGFLPHFDAPAGAGISLRTERRPAATRLRRSA